MTQKAIIVSAPSGAGKSTIVHRLMQRFAEMEFSVSACTRPKRGAEAEGKEYYFLSAEPFLEKVANGEFVEWEEVYPGSYYGTLKSELNRIWGLRKIPVFDVDVKGGLNLKKYFGASALAFFIQPPSLKILEQRLRTRSTESEESLRKRLSKAEYEMSFADKFDEVLVNDDLAQTVDQAIVSVRNFLE
ncbi:MAG: guanylate kinase [bacterium]